MLKAKPEGIQLVPPGLCEKSRWKVDYYLRLDHDRRRRESGVHQDPATGDGCSSLIAGHGRMFRIRDARMVSRAWFIAS